MSASEEKTKGLVAGKLGGIPNYPIAHNTTVDGITWFKEDSYKGTAYNWLSNAFAKASKKQNLSEKGTPDFIVVNKNSNVIIVIECKGQIKNHCCLKTIQEYTSYGFGLPSETESYAINGALWYASFLSDVYDVIAVAVSGQSIIESKVTSFVWPKGAEVSDIALLEDGTLSDSIVSITQYAHDIDIVLGRDRGSKDEIVRELRRYTLACANYLRANGIEDNSKAGFVSAIILGLTNQESKLYFDTKSAVDQKLSSKTRRIPNDSLSKKSVRLLKASLYGDGNEYEPDYIRGIWDIDRIPKGKRTALKRYYDTLLAKSELTQAPKGKDKYFPDGDTVLSCCILSLYENVIRVVEKYSGIDVMGEFYTTFLRFTKGNAKEKGIVLTPNHITELFCDIAEYFAETKFGEKTRIIDICCGTGSFLIAALQRIKRNIHAKTISETKKAELYSIAQQDCLIGVERDSSMYALAYANMRFHGDGKSNLFNCSSLLIDSYAPVDDSGKTYLDDQQIPLYKALASFGDIDIGMINPPYSLDKKDKNSAREYQLLQDINELSSKNINLERTLRQFRKNPSANEREISRISKEIQANSEKIDLINAQLTAENLHEVVISKGQSELDFVAAMLHYLKVGGIGVAIVPMSCAGSSGTDLRSKLLDHHTLLACMTMPNQLFFDSHVGTATCIMVFKAHVPHDSSKSVFFGIWSDDGFSVIPHNGRKDTGLWDRTKQLWVDQLDGTAVPNDTKWLRHRINGSGEALPEAYVKTDFTKLDEESFKKIVRKYALFKFMDSKSALDIKDSDKMNWLLDNYNEFEQYWSAPKCKAVVHLNQRQWREFQIGGIEGFDGILNDLHNGKAYDRSDLIEATTEDYVFYITRTDQNNGVSLCVPAQDYPGLESKNAITIGDTTATIFFHDKEFIVGPHIIVLRADWLNPYTAQFLIAVLNMEKYRYPVFGRAFVKTLISETKVVLPIDDNGNPDYSFMEQYIKSLPYSSNIE